MSESGEVNPLSADTRILHVLAETTGPVVEVAKLAVLGCKLPQSIACRRGVNLDFRIAANKLSQGRWYYYRYCHIGVCILCHS